MDIYPPGMTDSCCRALYRQWHVLASVRSPPHPDGFSQDRLLFFLQDICFVRVEQTQGGRRFVFHEVGAALEKCLGDDLQDRTFTVARGERPRATGFLTPYLLACDSGLPQFSYLRCRLELRENQPVRLERLVLPFSAQRNEVVTDLVSFVRFSHPDALSATRNLPRQGDETNR